MKVNDSWNSLAERFNTFTASFNVEMTLVNVSKRSVTPFQTGVIFSICLIFLMPGSGADDINYYVQLN